MIFVCKHIHEYLSLHTILIYLHLKNLESKYKGIFLSFTIKHATFLDLQKRGFVFETYYLETI